MKKIIYLLLIWLLNGCDTCPSSQDEEDVFSQAFIGLSSRCAIKEKDKTVVCWPSSSSRIKDGPENIGFLKVTNGISFVWSIKQEDETVMCWGAKGKKYFINRDDLDDWRGSQNSMEQAMVSVD